MEYYLRTTKAEFIQAINKIRLANKNKWVFIYANVDGEDIFIKNYNTYLQRFIINGMRHESGAMDMSVSAWKEELGGWL